MIDFNPPPVIGLVTDTGTGKTRQWILQVAAGLVTRGMRPVIAVPRHQLGEEVAGALAKVGIEARVYRGRDADDPLAPGHKMCIEQERVESIQKALGSVPERACKNRGKQCQFYETCGYQQQQRQRPQVWIVPHQLLFQERPDFIPHPAALAIDETFYGAALRGFGREPMDLPLRLLKGDRRVPGRFDKTADLTAISERAYAMLTREESGRIRADAILDANLTTSDLDAAYNLDWNRKKDINEVYPNMPVEEVNVICQPAAYHNQNVKRLTTFWNLMRRMHDSDDERSPYLELIHDEGVVRMRWREDIHPSWSAPTTIMDATMRTEIVQQFFPYMPDPIRILAPAPHTYIRQVIDRPMSSLMLIPKEGVRAKTNTTARNNAQRVARLIEVRAQDVAPGRVLVVCQEGLEEQLAEHRLRENVALRHFNDVSGENSYSDVALLLVIGRTQPGPQAVEQEARAIFGVDIPETPTAQWYPMVERGVQMRDGGVAAILTPQHPDWRAEAVRWAICEGGLMQAIGRGRAVNRTAKNPLQIDILTHVPVPLVTDELITWELTQPTLAETMHARGAVPLTYGDMAKAYPDLFDAGGEAARKALGRENPGQTPIEKYLIGVCPGFLAIEYRRKGSRGPASKLLYDPARVPDPFAWLTEHVGTVELTAEPQPLKRKPRQRAPNRKPVTVGRVTQLHILHRRAECIDIGGEAWVSFDAVSYTHLTLPTILRV